MNQLSIFNYFAGVYLAANGKMFSEIMQSY